MSGIFGRIKVLNADEMELLQQGAFDILEQVGMMIHHPESRELLGRLGCRVERSSPLVKFPEWIVRQAAERLKGDFLRPERKGLKQGVRYTQATYYKRDEELFPDFTVNSGGFCTLIYDLDRNRRATTMQDVHDGFKLVNALDEITLSGLPCSDQSIPAPLRPVKMAAELVKYTAKLGGIEAWTIQDVRYIKEIAVVVRGSEGNLRARPCLVGYADAAWRGIGTPVRAGARFRVHAVRELSAALGAELLEQLMAIGASMTEIEACACTLGNTDLA